MITTSAVNENSATRVVPPSVLLIGKKPATNYIAPGLLRLNNTGKVIIKATGSLSIVTAVDVAELIKRDVQNVITEAISLGTDSLVVSTGESKRMSCIEIALAKFVPMPEAVTPVAKVAEETPAEVTLAATKKTKSRKKRTASVSKKRKITRKKRKAS